MRAATARVMKSGAGGTRPRPNQARAAARPAKISARPKARLPADGAVATKGGHERDDREDRAHLEGQDGPQADQGQGHVERGEDREREQHVAEPRPRADEAPVPRIDRRQERAPRHGDEEEDVARAERGRGVVRREHEEQHAVIEALDRVRPRPDHAVTALLAECGLELGERREEEPEEEQVAGHPADMRQSAAEHEQRQETQDEGAERDAPGLEPGEAGPACEEPAPERAHRHHAGIRTARPPPRPAAGLPDPRPRQ